MITTNGEAEGGSREHEEQEETKSKKKAKRTSTIDEGWLKKNEEQEEDQHVGWSKPTRTLVPRRQGFRHPTRNECVSLFTQIQHVEKTRKPRIQIGGAT